jgi:2-C-methyl-D-erythritol 4-phosphate cytidylyltransferase
MSPTAAGPAARVAGAHLAGRVFAAVPAAGMGTRMGLGYSKAYLAVEGVPLLARALHALLACPAIDRVWAAVRPDELDLCRSEVLKKWDLSSRVTLVAGGEERQDTVGELLRHAPPDRGLVLVHDGARPFPSRDLVLRVLTAAEGAGAAVAALPASDTVKLSGDGRTVARTVDRGTVWLAQTPQAFHRDIVAGAYRRAHKEGFRGTDDASLVEWAGHEVALVPGERGNIKVTTPEDLAFAGWMAGRKRG